MLRKSCGGRSFLDEERQNVNERDGQVDQCCGNSWRACVQSSGNAVGAWASSLTKVCIWQSVSSRP